MVMVIAMSILAGWMALLVLARRQFFHIALIGFPGVVLHELMHLLVGLVLLAKPVSMNLWPRRAGNHWHFGSVAFTGLNLFNAAPVAYAPLLLLPAAWIALHHWMLPQVQRGAYTIAVLWGYVIACGVFYSLPSVTDLKAAGWSTVFWLAMAAVSVAIWFWPH